MVEMHPSPTQKQIASKLGVSQTLVSRALSGRADKIGASTSTVEKIRRAAAEWNYQPSATALALLGAPTRTFGVVVKNFNDPYFGRLIGALQTLARENSHSLLLTGSSMEDLSGLQKHRVDGVILVGSDFRPQGLRAFACEGMPIIQIGTGSPFPGDTQIHMDEAAGIGELVTYLAGLGHREIGFVAKDAGANSRRGELLRRALQSHRLSVRTKFFLSFDGIDSEVAEYAVKTLRSFDRMPTALVAAEDSIALALLRALHEAGFSVPQDLSVAGIDDIDAAAQSIPPLTTLRQPIPEMGAEAFRSLIALGTKRNPVTLPGKVIVRHSCASPSPQSK
jgi:DNA-binding LacI/PurR family transcriptional regulator